MVDAEAVIAINESWEKKKKSGQLWISRFGEGATWSVRDRLSKVWLIDVHHRDDDQDNDRETSFYTST